MKRFTATITILLFLLLSSLTVIGQTTNIYINGKEWKEDRRKYLLYTINTITFLVNRETWEFEYYGRHVNIDTYDEWRSRWNAPYSKFVTKDGLSDDSYRESIKIIETDKYGHTNIRTVMPRFFFCNFSFRIDRKVYEYNKKQVSTNDVSILGSYYYNYYNYDYNNNSGHLDVLEEDFVYNIKNDDTERLFIKIFESETNDSRSYYDETKLSERLKDIHANNFPFEDNNILFIPLDAIHRMYEESIRIYNDDVEYNRAVQIAVKNEMFKARGSKEKIPIDKWSSL